MSKTAQLRAEAEFGKPGEPEMLIQAWASQKSFRKKEGPDGDGTNFHGQQRKNETHESTTDPDARLYKKSYGKESHLAYLGHALVENRNGLIAAAMATQADGYAEREAALLLLEEKQKGSSKRITVGADKAYDTRDFVTRRPIAERDRACDQTREGTPFEHGSQNHPASRLRDQPETAMAGREELRMAEADRPTPPGETARSA